jgi:hypothetical protein
MGLPLLEGHARLFGDENGRRTVQTGNSAGRRSGSAGDGQQNGRNARDLTEHSSAGQQMIVQACRKCGCKRDARPAQQQIFTRARTISSCTSFVIIPAAAQGNRPELHGRSKRSSTTYRV